jgi:hypothetical protein
VTETDVATIESSLKECESHTARIGRARKLLGSIFPLSDSALAALGEDDIEHLDQLIYRFTRLQDSMGTRLLPALYAYVEQNDAPTPFLSILDRLEKLGILTSAADWQFFRNLRNNLAHDYPGSLAQSVATLNTLYLDVPKLVAMFGAVRGYWQGLPAREQTGS